MTLTIKILKEEMSNKTPSLRTGLTAVEIHNQTTLLKNPKTITKKSKSHWKKLRTPTVEILKRTKSTVKWLKTSLTSVTSKP